MTIPFLPEEYTRATRTTVVVPVSGKGLLTDPATRRVLTPASVEMTVTRVQGPKPRTYRTVGVSGLRRLKAGSDGREITSYGWEAFRNYGRFGYAQRPDWLTDRIFEHMPSAMEPYPGRTSDDGEPETDEQREDRLEAERLHAAGDHKHCDETCEVELPSDHLRNFIVAKGYPGAAGALDELLRRAAAPAVLADRAAVLNEVVREYEQLIADIGADTVKDPRYWSGVQHVLIGLRHLAGEATDGAQDTFDSLAGGSS
ncbi:hypothetical protein [Streptomyces sp. NPDC018055]|uniref:hypothetical protein n=1 Tax=Streptomyces sp. NPDC018055 TaxID=3365038 RepID=UPI003794DC72